jgi:hypothetical protein
VACTSRPLYCHSFQAARPACKSRKKGEIINAAALQQELVHTYTLSQSTH